MFHSCNRCAKTVCTQRLPNEKRALPNRCAIECSSCVKGIVLHIAIRWGVDRVGLGRLNRQQHLNVAVRDPCRIAPKIGLRRTAKEHAVANIELSSVKRTLDDGVIEIPIRQQRLAVWTDIVRRQEPSAGIVEGDMETVDFMCGHLPGRKVVDRREIMPLRSGVFFVHRGSPCCLQLRSKEANLEDYRT